MSHKPYFVALALLALTAPAFGACNDFVWADDQEGMVATQTEPGQFDITLDGDKIDHCTAGKVEGGLAARCDEGWEGPMILAGSTPKANDNGILVLLNTVFYRVCR